MFHYDFSKGYAVLVFLSGIKDKDLEHITTELFSSSSAFISRGLFPLEFKYRRVAWMSYPNFFAQGKNKRMINYYALQIRNRVMHIKY